MSSENPLFEVVPAEHAEPIVLHTSQGELTVAADLTAEEFAILDELRRESGNISR
ncbi:hypothetical protein ACFXJ8_00940 [Nonomuraea sp. NPDC059194]|uniref:hypothetical protein n=1 Tax=Nonomuraea sp. NPDC059194 TaxID=3346764 RepID=UPI003692CA77